MRINLTFVTELWRNFYSWNFFTSCVFSILTAEDIIIQSKDEEGEGIAFQDKGPTYSADAIKLMIRDVVKYPIRKQHRITLNEIGLVMQKLMGGGYESLYCQKDFRRKVERLKNVNVRFW